MVPRGIKDTVYPWGAVSGTNVCIMRSGSLNTSRSVKDESVKNTSGRTAGFEEVGA